MPGARNAKMNYKQYEIQIVQKYLVDLKGWPHNIVFANPSAIGSIPKLVQLRDALLDKSCCWEQISDEEAKKNRKDREHASNAAINTPKEQSDGMRKRKLSMREVGTCAKTKVQRRSSSSSGSDGGSSSDSNLGGEEE